MTSQSDQNEDLPTAELEEEIAKASEPVKKISPFGPGVNFGAKNFGNQSNARWGAPKGGFNKQRPGRGAARGR